jgi:D-sedoheptulose 7-phosphate isomerase
VKIQDFVEDYAKKLSQVVARVDAAAIAQAIEWLREACREQRTIYSCGNGGSAAIASQMVVDIVKGASMGRTPRFKMIGLTDNIGTLLAYGNDVNYESIFVEPLKNFASKGDILIAISGSGNSPNVLRAVEYANSIGCKTIGLTTAMGGRLKDISQLPLLVPTDHMGRLEDCFFAMTHILCYAFIEGVG